jgi:uncharacterized protein
MRYKGGCMSAVKPTLEWVPGAFAVCRLSPTAAIPPWVSAGARRALFSVTRTDRELSIVAPQDVVPEDSEAERGWVALRVAGKVELSTVGLLAQLTGALAEAGVPLLAISTYETDILLVKSTSSGRAVEALRRVADVEAL